MQESVGGAMHRATVKQLFQSASGDVKILLFGKIFFGFLVFYLEIRLKCRAAC